VRYQPPAEAIGENGITVRNDTGVYEGGEISIWYDPMIAKLCTHAPTRAAAISAMSTALDQFVIEGIQHNIPFVAAIMENPVWQSGKLSTGFIAEQYPDGFKGRHCQERMPRSWRRSRCCSITSKTPQAPHLRSDEWTRSAV
jgi:propionyl-CoA carboxylase alpha chain